VNDALVLLQALNEHQTWHTPGFLAGKALIPADWPSGYVNKLALELEHDGLAETRYSASRGQLMYKITLTGQERLRHLSLSLEGSRA